MPQNETLQFALIFLLIIAIAAILLLRHLSQKRYYNFVLENSLCLQKLDEINNRYLFYPSINFDKEHVYDNEIFYNDISCEDYLIYQLQFIRKKICDQMEKIKLNQQRYSEYIGEINAITQFGQFKAPIGKLKPEKLKKMEKRLLEKYPRLLPSTEFTLTITLFCSKINGEVYDKKSETFSSDEIRALITRLNKKRGVYYADRKIWDAICRVERGKVSNKMRFSIYARDGYRCRKCGVSNQHAQLEIDHIIPIAKGGKSTYDNLQTLCHRCNVLKGDNLY